MHGEEEVLVRELGDERELPVEQCLDGRWRAAGPAHARARVRECAQVRAGREPGGHELRGVLVAQAPEVEAATLRDRHGLGQQRGRVEGRQHVAPAQVSLAVRKQARAGLVDRAAVADRGEQVLQAPPAAPVHVHVTGGHGRQPRECGERHALGEAFAITRAAQQLDGHPAAAGEVRGEPARIGFGFGRGAAGGRRRRRQPQRQAVLQPGLEVGAPQ